MFLTRLATSKLSAAILKPFSVLIFHKKSQMLGYLSQALYLFLNLHQACMHYLLMAQYRRTRLQILQAHRFFVMYVTPFR